MPTRHTGEQILELAEQVSTIAAWKLPKLQSHFAGQLIHFCDSCEALLTQKQICKARANGMRPTLKILAE